LPQAIESVLNQQFSDFELIVCDDGSTDDSAEIAERYARKDSRLTVQRNRQRLGLFANYNQCLKKSSAQYIKLFAQDDLLEPAMLAQSLAALDAHPEVTLVSTAKRWIDDDGVETKVLRPFEEQRVINGRDVIIYNLLRLTNWVGEPSAVMFRRERLGDGFDTQLYHYGDIDYWFRIVDGASMIYLDEVLLSFRRHRQSATSKNHHGLYFALDIMRLGKKYRRHLSDFGESEEQFFNRAMEVIALDVDHFVRTSGLTASICRGADSGSPAGESDNRAENDGEPVSEAAAFRELSFHAFRYITKVLADLDDLKCRSADEKRYLEAQIADMRESTSWRVTAPLRNLAKQIRS
jgi:glycosyltransferase involved in cell wall biosynthesis